jgi:phenylalanyl-tRNA synthetase alpha chain
VNDRGPAATLEMVRQAGQAALEALERVTGEDDLERWRQAELGKNGRIAQLLRQIPSAPPADRPAFGAAVNAAKSDLEAALAAAHDRLAESAMQAELAAERIDVTLPGTWPARGGLHPATRVMRRVCAVLADMGFQTYLSREVETDEMNFELLNIPPHHPARDMQDTFYLSDGLLLRTHTSPGQIRAMRAYAPEPLRIIVPGMCYRHEQITPRSEIQFHQVEGLAIGRSITMADLRGTLAAFAGRMFGADRAVRFRASYFPFTEPSAEMDVECFLCGGAGCRVCKQTGWLEILGCGMVHPVVLANGGYDPDRMTGFAFGMGIERMAMLIDGIDDIRHFWANDLRFLSQLG